MVLQVTKNSFGRIEITGAQENIQNGKRSKGINAYQAGFLSKIAELFARLFKKTTAIKTTKGRLHFNSRSLENYATRIVDKNHPALQQMTKQFWKDDKKIEGFFQNCLARVEEARILESNLNNEDLNPTEENQNLEAEVLVEPPKNEEIETIVPKPSPSKPSLDSLKNKAISAIRVEELSQLSVEELKSLLVENKRYSAYYRLHDLTENQLNSLLNKLETLELVEHLSFRQINELDLTKLSLKTIIKISSKCTSEQLKALKAFKNDIQALSKEELQNIRDVALKIFKVISKFFINSQILEMDINFWMMFNQSEIEEIFKDRESLIAQLSNEVIYKIKLTDSLKSYLTVEQKQYIRQTTEAEQEKMDEFLKKLNEMKGQFQSRDQEAMKKAEEAAEKERLLIQERMKMLQEQEKARLSSKSNQHPVTPETMYKLLQETKNSLVAAELIRRDEAIKQAEINRQQPKAIDKQVSSQKEIEQESFLIQKQIEDFAKALEDMVKFIFENKINHINKSNAYNFINKLFELFKEFDNGLKKLSNEITIINDKTEKLLISKVIKYLKRLFHEDRCQYKFGQAIYKKISALNF